MRLIKANISCRIGLRTASKTDRVCILDHKGCEELLGNGDAIIKYPSSVEECRFQAAYTPDDVIDHIVRYYADGAKLMKAGQGKKQS